MQELSKFLEEEKKRHLTESVLAFHDCRVRDYCGHLFMSKLVQCVIEKMEDPSKDPSEIFKKNFKDFLRF